jgi:alkanesulfonate monooxygenase SsuD/methylene tetrahydromethanopterin reductase-like flavin-dependent oxidoreductase (luciferase family)
MRLGVITMSSRADSRALTGAALSQAARVVEETGFDSLWWFDAIGRGFMLPDPLVALSVAAAATARIEVGTCILQVPLRRPVELAHRILTAHVVCAGRLLLGVGAGSTRADFEAVGVDFDARMTTLDASLSVMRRLWRGERVGAADLSPWPNALGGPPMLIGSWSGQQWIARAAREFDGWIASAAKTSFATLADGIRRFRAAGGKRAVVTNIAADLSATGRADDDGAPFDLRCPPAVAADRLKRLAGLGFDDAVLVTGTADERTLAGLRALLPS